MCASAQAWCVCRVVGRALRKRDLLLQAVSKLVIILVMISGPTLVSKAWSACTCGSLLYKYYRHVYFNCKRVSQKYGCSIASRAQAALGGYSGGACLTDPVSRLTKCWFSLWTNLSQRLRECLDRIGRETTVVLLQLLCWVSVSNSSWGPYQWKPVVTHCTMCATICSGLLGQLLTSHTGDTTIKLKSDT